LSLIILFLGLAVWLTLFISFVLFLQVILAAFNWRRYKKTPSVSIQRNSSVVFLIPAHNEEDVIIDTLKSIDAEFREGDEIVVVADNCKDKTRELADNYGATVLERIDEVNKGKGFALDFGLEYLRKKHCQVIIIVDADCMLVKGCRDFLVREVLESGRPVQALYMMKGSESSLSQKFAQFVWAIKNKIRPLGSSSLGSPCQLTGTGMAFPAELIYKINIASGCIVEDLKLGLDLSISGNPPRFLPEATVWSSFPESDDAAEGQKSRWVHGHLEMIFKYTPKLFLQFLKTFDLRLLLLMFDLMIPPLMMLLIMNILIFLLSFSVFVFYGGSLFLYSFVSTAFLVLSVFISWWLEGRNYLSFKEFYLGGLGIFKKLAVYAKFFTNKRTDWNKTSRK
jgi:cellulose synthase/poly-beta-1,6-N-acetylglucosamine synthase-like glycosyltransferase